jgi:hypothetical protein
MARRFAIDSLIALSRLQKRTDRAKIGHSAFSPRASLLALHRAIVYFLTILIAELFVE